MNKRTGRLCFLILCLAAVLGSSLSRRMVSAASEMEKMRVIKVGYFAFDGYHEEDSDGIKSGYGYDFLQYMARYANVTYEYVGYGDSWEDMQQMLENEEIDLVTSARKTKKRCKKFAFSDKDIGYSSAILTVKSDNDNIRAGEYKTYDGMRVAMLRGNSRNTEFERFAGKHGFRYRPIYYETAEGLHLALMEGVVNAALTSDLRMTRDEKCLERFGESPFYVITRKEDTDLMDLVNDALNQMDLKQTGWRQELRRKYYASSGSVSRYLTSDEKKYIRGLSKENRSLMVITRPDTAPYSFADGSGNAGGILPELFRKVMTNVGISCQIVVPDSLQTYKKMQGSGEAVICLDMTDGLSEAENAGYKLTDCYFERMVEGEQKKFCAGIYKREDVRLMSILNKSIAGLDTEEIETIVEEYMSKDGTLSVRSQGGQNPWMIGLAVESIVLLILCAILLLRSYGMAFAYRKRSKNTRKERKTYGNDKHDNG